MTVPIEFKLLEFRVIVKSDFLYYKGRSLHPKLLALLINLNILELSY